MAKVAANYDPKRESRLPLSLNDNTNAHFKKRLEICALLSEESPFPEDSRDWGQAPSMLLARKQSIGDIWQEMLQISIRGNQSTGAGWWDVYKMHRSHNDDQIRPLTLKLGEDMMNVRKKLHAVYITLGAEQRTNASLEKLVEDDVLALNTHAGNLIRAKHSSIIMLEAQDFAARLQNTLPNVILNIKETASLREIELAHKAALADLSVTDSPKKRDQIDAAREVMLLPDEKRLAVKDVVLKGMMEDAMGGPDALRKTAAEIAQRGGTPLHPKSIPTHGTTPNIRQH